MLQGIGLLLYYLTRVYARLSLKFWNWVIVAYLRAKSKSCGDVGVYGYGRFVNVSGLEIGNNVHINFGANWICDGGLRIDDNVHVSSHCTIYTRNHNSRGSALPYDDVNVARPVSIGRNVWIGANVTILPGSKIGEGAIIGAGAVVHGAVPDFAIVGAAAPVTIGERDRAHYADLDSRKQYGGAGGRLLVKNREHV